MKAFRVALASAVLAAATALAQLPSVQAVSDERALASAYLLSTLAEQVATKAVEAFGNVAATNGPSPREAAVEWKARIQQRIRGNLEARFGASARGRYETFVTEFLAAEQCADPEALRALHEKAGLQVPPTDYASFRRLAVESWLQADVAAAGDFLARVEAWVDLSGRVPATPPLDFWLGATSPKSAAPPPPTPVNRLAAAEATPAPIPAPDDDEGDGALSAFATARKTSRQQRVELAQSQMQQLATEREQWEQEWGRKKAARAQAEVEAMRRQAEALVQADKDALEQHKNSWGYRMKSVVSAVIGTTLGAFGTPIAQKAGEEAAQELFDLDD